jgi:hypothetical protein
LPSLSSTVLSEPIGKLASGIISANGIISTKFDYYDNILVAQMLSLPASSIAGESDENRTLCPGRTLSLFHDRNSLFSQNRDFMQAFELA